MNILAIDTSNQVMGVALLNNETVIAEHMTNLKRNHSVQLMPAIKHLMNDTKLTPDMLDKIVVAKGPGSFTGIRIGLTTAKTLAWSLGIPVVGVSSLKALAYQGYLSNALICPFFDARRSNVYTGLFTMNGSSMVMEREEQNVKMAEWLEELHTLGKRVLFISPDMLEYREMICEVMGDSAIIPRVPDWLARPSHVALAGMYQEPTPTHALVPNYLRLAEAEAKWRQAQKEQSNNG